MPLARATALYGAGGEGKTLLAQMLATACAIGALWLGLPVLRCNSLLLFCEDDLDEMHRRQEDINRAYGCAFADLGAMRWLPRLGDDNALMQFTDGRAHHTDLFHELLSAAKEHEARLTITDTLADIFAGNENDRGQARAFTQQALGYLARETQGAALALAHPSRAGINSGSGESGSTAWIGTFRSQLYMSTPRGDGEAEPADPDLRILTRRKSNAARRNETIEMRWQNGVFLSTAPPGGIIGTSSGGPASASLSTSWSASAPPGSTFPTTREPATMRPASSRCGPTASGSARPISSAPCTTCWRGREIAIASYRDKSRHEHECLERTPA